MTLMPGCMKSIKRGIQPIQMKLGEYHQCQQTILNAVKKGGFVSQATPQNGTRIAPACNKVKNYNNSSINNSSINNSNVNKQQHQQQTASTPAAAVVKATGALYEMEPILSAEMSSRMSSIVELGKRPARDYRGLEVMPETEKTYI